MSFRHLERDLFHRQALAADSPGSQFLMLWPNWEGGFGDLHMWTMLPLGLALRMMAAFELHARHLWRVVFACLACSFAARSICTFERYDEVPDGANTVREGVHNPLPRCAPRRQCFRDASLVPTDRAPPKSTRPWEAQSNLDGLLGFPFCRLLVVPTRR